MRIQLFMAVAVGGVAAMLAMSSPQADERIGSWLVVDNVPDAIYLVDEIDFHTPLDFHRAMEERPNARTIILNSPGGSVSDGLLIAEDVHERGFNTYIPQGQGCYSACSYIFLAGISRRADGELGVHQISSDVQSNANMQFTVSDVLHVLEKFNTPPELIDRMFRTPSESIYVFTPEELVSLGINRDGGQAAASPATTSPQPPQPGRWIALYAGVDFYGDDISGDARNAANLVECTRACLDDSQCKAFTFNTNPKYAAGTNCFLKSGSGRFDAYQRSASGMIVDSQSAAGPLSFAAIDATTDIRAHVDLAGYTIGGQLAGVTTVDGCRTACIGDDQCVAFSMQLSTRACFLKSAVGPSISDPDYLSAVKRQMSVAPNLIPVDQ